MRMPTMQWSKGRGGGGRAAWCARHGCRWRETGMKGGSPPRCSRVCARVWEGEGVDHVVGVCVSRLLQLHYTRTGWRSKGECTHSEEAPVRMDEQATHTAGLTREQRHTRTQTRTGAQTHGSEAASRAELEDDEGGRDGERRRRSEGGAECGGDEVRWVQLCVGGGGGRGDQEDDKMGTSAEEDIVSTSTHADTHALTHVYA